MQHTLAYGYTRIHFSTNDAVFRTLNGEPITMEFHRYCGPSFSLNDEFYMPENESPEWENLWNQFDGWWNAKGSGIYDK